MAWQWRPSPLDSESTAAFVRPTRWLISTQVVAGTHVHVLGSAQNIKVARDAICDLIIGAPPGKVYNRMRTVAKRLHSRL